VSVLIDFSNQRQMQLLKQIANRAEGKTLEELTWVELVAMAFTNDLEDHQGARETLRRCAKWAEVARERGDVKRERELVQEIVKQKAIPTNNEDRRD